MIDKFELKKIIAIILLTFVLSCDKLETFELNRDIISSIGENDNCLKLLDDGFGVNKETLKEVGYLENLLDNIIDENKDVKYHRLIFLKIYEEGEVISTSKITFGVLENRKGLLKKYYSENNQRKVELKKVKNIDLDILYNKIGEPQNKVISGRRTVLIIDFKNADYFECKLYDDLSINHLNKIKELIIFDE